MIKWNPITRRFFMQLAGQASLALPLLPSLLSRSARAQLSTSPVTRAVFNCTRFDTLHAGGRDSTLPGIINQDSTGQFKVVNHGALAPFSLVNRQQMNYSGSPLPAQLGDMELVSNRYSDALDSRYRPYPIGILAGPSCYTSTGHNQVTASGQDLNATLWGNPASGTLPYGLVQMPTYDWELVQKLGAQTPINMLVMNNHSSLGSSTYGVDPSGAVSQYTPIRALQQAFSIVQQACLNTGGGRSVPNVALQLALQFQAKYASKMSAVDLLTYGNYLQELADLQRRLAAGARVIPCGSIPAPGIGERAVLEGMVDLVAFALKWDLTRVAKLEVFDLYGAPQWHGIVHTAESDPLVLTQYGGQDQLRQVLEPAYMDTALLRLMAALDTPDPTDPGQTSTVLDNVIGLQMSEFGASHDQNCPSLIIFGGRWGLSRGANKRFIDLSAPNNPLFYVRNGANATAQGGTGGAYRLLGATCITRVWATIYDKMQSGLKFDPAFRFPLNSALTSNSGRAAQRAARSGLVITNDWDQPLPDSLFT